MKTTTPPVYAIEPREEVFRVLRNARPLMTPQGNPYDLPREALARAVADEWRAQTDKIDPKIMPFTQLAATALDIAQRTRINIIDGLLAYASSDLLCHRAETPVSLAARQNEVWQPVLTWFAERTGAQLCVTNGVMPAAQNPAVVPALRDVLETFDAFHLTGLRQAAEVAGSLVLALALTESRLTAAQVFEACELDVTYQGAQWGEDPVTLCRQKAIRFDLDAAETWFELLRG